ncbi:helix-turn-helix transcriptional regulator [Chryseobacterium lactis]|uniref:helix-turn-helix transcriptional regulator n=1 Tax=Chryseobacterium lactis TaxID=1241981 RepID=UPI001623DE25|nr:helix-turn-helix transcriptional regulator [Chryseobacterium lactis]
MNEFKTDEIKKMVSEKIKEIKGVTPYSKISERCNVTAARISDVANNKIDCQLSTFIEIATGLRIHPKELFDIVFDFEEYYSGLDK